MVNEVYKLIIIGSGPAGLTAAIYAARSSLSPLVITGHEEGGQLTLTTDVEDFPGFPEGLQGPELMDRMKRQAERFGTSFIGDSVVAVNFKERPFTVSMHDQELKAQSVIVATGASARWLGLPSEQRLIGHGVSSCAVCDGYFFKNKEVVVVGGGDSSMREAIYLAKLASQVTIVHRRESFRAQQILQDRARANSKIFWCVPMEVTEVLGASMVSGVRLKNITTGEIKTINCQGVFVAIGHKPNTELFRGELGLDEAGYIISPDGVHTNIAGVFVAGDVEDQKYRQAVTAAGRGCAAAMEAEEYLENLKSEFKS